MKWIHTKLQTYAERTACFEAGRAWTYAEFIELIEQTGADLPRAKSAVIEVQAPTTIEGLATLLAIAERGQIALPLPLEIPTTECARMRGIAASSPLYDRLEGSGLILFSSGTSGEPKSMLHNFDALLNRFNCGLQAARSGTRSSSLRSLAPLSRSARMSPKAMRFVCHFQI